MNEQSKSRWDHEPSEPEISVGGPVSIETERLEGDLVAERFGKYLIVGEVAIGGMAEVFLGVQRGLEGVFKVVVVKRVLPQYGTNEEFARMFVDEARVAARLEHRNIVRTYEFGEVDGQYYTAMEYLPGEDLNKVLGRLVVSQQDMAIETAALVVAQVCAGLHFAHQLTDVEGNPLNLVHRDINPANIIITYSGDVKIIDFGVAKTNTGATTQTGTIKGKLAYMSPEQILARGIDQRSDVFSTGVVLWELLTGRPLFMRDNEAATLYAIMNDSVPAPSHYRRDVPPALDAIVLRALARDVDDRFASAEDMQTALEEFLEGRPRCDARVLAQTLESLFGTTRAEAKRSISQSRALAKNVSLAMKLRSEVRRDLAEMMNTRALTSDPVRSANPVESDGGNRLGVIALGMVIVAALVGGVIFALRADPTSTPAANASTRTKTATTVQIETTPPGAAVSIGGEPTGMKTPATLTGLTDDSVEIRVELPGYDAMSETIDISKGGTIKKQFTFADGNPSRLVVSGLPAGTLVIFDGEEHQAGEVILIPPGAHEVRIVMNGRTLATQRIEASPGIQAWKLDDSKLHRMPSGT